MSDKPWPLWAKILTGALAVTATGTALYYGAPHIKAWINKGKGGTSGNDAELTRLATKAASKDPETDPQKQQNLINHWKDMLKKLSAAELAAFDKMMVKSEHDYTAAEKAIIAKLGIAG